MNHRTAIISHLTMALITLSVLLLAAQLSSADPQLSVNLSTTSVTSNLPQTCSQEASRHSGVQLIHPQPGFGDPFEVFCDQSYESGDWVVIQNRYAGSVHFYRGWTDYERGFGNMNGEFWLGLAKIHELTYSRRYELHVLLEDWEGIRAVARYSEFLMTGPEEGYELRSLGSYSGNAGDAMSYNLGMKFSTFDNDNDPVSSSNCAVNLRSAWWFRACSLSNLNGLHKEALNVTSMFWNTFRDDFYGLKSARMIIKAVN